MSARSSTAIAALPVRSVWLLLAGFLGAVLLNLHHAALWCLPVALLACAWRLRAAARGSLLSARWLKIAVVLALTAAVLVSFHTLNGLSAGASLLVAMAALKLAETARQRDWMIVVGSSMFLLLAACLDAQGLWRMPLYVIELWLLCSALYAVGAGARENSTRELAARAGRTLLGALPVAVLLFLLFPRLPGSFWALPQEDQAVTGLGDEMSPGGISRLTESDEPAMRVRFDSTPPPPAQRYWRGPVMHRFDGYTWRRQRGEIGPRQPVRYLGTGYTYQITLEPNTINVLPALDLPLGGPEELPQAFSTFDDQLILPQPMDHTISYHLLSFSQHQAVEPLSEAARTLDLQLPTGRNPRSVELAGRLRAKASGNDGAYVDTVLDYLRHGGFTYTLTPSVLNRDSIDDLLFRTHQGFCGHYASAFVMLMRAGGVPARVVTGYLGGQWNRFGDYLLVRQSDAHAWAEVWLDTRGWVRVDPTAVVAPGRLTSALDELLPSGSGRRLRTAAWLAPTLQAWQAANAWWQDQFVGFNWNRQINLLASLGLRTHTLRALAVLMGIGGAAWLGVVSWTLRSRQRRPGESELQRSWRLLERKLRDQSAPRAPHEGPVAYAERIGRARPDLAPMLTALARRYARLRYGPPAGAAENQQFQRAVRSLRLPPPPSLTPGAA